MMASQENAAVAASQKCKLPGNGWHYAYTEFKINNEQLRLFH